MKAYRKAVPLSVLALLAAGAPAFGLIFADAVIEAHRTRMQELVNLQETILAQADAEKREVTVEERAQIDNAAAEFDRLEGEVDRRIRMAAQQLRLSQPQPRQSAPDPIAGDDDPRSANNARGVPAFAAARELPPRFVGAAAGNFGWRSFGDFASSVRKAVAFGLDSADQRLKNATASTYTSESVGADGGFLVPPDFQQQITQRLFNEDSLLGRCDQQETSSNQFNAPVDETTPWGTGGIKAFFEGEADAAAQNKPKFNNSAVRLHKLVCLVPVTEEMLEDSAQIGGYLGKKMPEAMDWTISYNLGWGTGVGMPLGFMNSGALVVQAAEGGQAVDTINQPNISKMFSRMPTNSLRTAVWLIHPDATPQLDALVVGTTPVYMPPGALSDTPFGRLKGRPVIPHQICSTVGDLGDFMLVDFAQYLAPKKVGGIKVQQSIHLWFDQGITAFKANFRLGGQPWWAAPMTPRSGTNTQSPFVTLAAR